LVDAVLSEVERFYRAMADEIHSQPLSAPQILLSHGLAFAASVDTHPDHARVWLDWSTAIRDEVWPRYLAFQAYVVKVLEKTIRRGQREGDLAADIDPEDNAHLMFGSAHMIAQMKFTRQSPGKIERFLHTLVRVAIGGQPLAGVTAYAREQLQAASRTSAIHTRKRPTRLYFTAPSRKMRTFFTDG